MGATAFSSDSSSYRKARNYFHLSQRKFFIQSKQVEYWKGLLSSMDRIPNKYVSMWCTWTLEGFSKIAQFCTSLSSNIMKTQSIFRKIRFRFKLTLEEFSNAFSLFTLCMTVWSEIHLSNYAGGVWVSAGHPRISLQSGEGGKFLQSVIHVSLSPCEAERFTPDWSSHTAQKKQVRYKWLLFTEYGQLQQE